MTHTHCRAPVALPTLIAYWLGELDAPDEAQVEEHLLGCSKCSAVLQGVVDLAGGIRSAVRRGRIGTVVASALPARLAAAGLRVREYRVARNGSVNCSVAPDDDVVVAHLEAPLAGIERLDVIVCGQDDDQQARLENVPFDAHTDEVVIAPDIAGLRAMPATTQRMRLVAVERGADRLLGEYTFHHTPWRAAPP
jgi:hypothetical protein